MRIAGVELPEEKRIDFALTQLFGVGWSLSRKILTEAGISPEKKSRELSEEEAGKLAQTLEHYAVEGELRRQVLQNIQRLKDTGSYRGMRHAHNLPSRGQRTRTNARTKRGKRKTVGAFKKEILAKTGRFAEGVETKEGK